MKQLFLFFTIIFIVMIQGCSKFSDNLGVTSTAGTYIYPDRLDKIKPGLYQTDVVKILGSPTFIKNFNKDTWYYIYQKTWYISVFAEKLVDQQIVILDFDSTSGKLLNIDVKYITDAKSLKYNSSTTKFYYKIRPIKPDLYN